MYICLTQVGRVEYNCLDSQTALLLSLSSGGLCVSSVQLNRPLDFSDSAGALSPAPCSSGDMGVGPQLLSSLWESVIKGDIRGRNKKCGEDRKGKSEVGKREYKGLFVFNTVFYVVGLNWCLLNE